MLNHHIVFFLFYFLSRKQIHQCVIIVYCVVGGWWLCGSVCYFLERELLGINHLHIITQLFDLLSECFSIILSNNYWHIFTLVQYLFIVSEATRRQRLISFIFFRMSFSCYSDGNL